MTFKSEYNSITGEAVFYVVETVRRQKFAEFSDYHAVACLLNDARRLGREEAANECAWRMQLLARDMGVAA
ncbi:hypothetical protein QF001_000903 [Paraburkholderia youngii]|uniref:hypothetical protein n=1 Tax=Paraburkholderia youngii TaxID=2782701 RepID=UPI003D25185E